MSGRGSRRKQLKRRYQPPIPPQSKRRNRDFRGRAALPLIVLGGLLFLAGTIGARTGVLALPFDPHHVFGQVGGGVILAIGLLWLGR